MRSLLLDTTVISDYLRGREPSAGLVHEYLKEQEELTLSILTWYEVDRGLRKVGSGRRRRILERLCRESRVLPVTREVLDRAADIWVDLQKRGRSVGEVDIMIASTALIAGFGIATRDRDYEVIPGLHVEFLRE